MSDMEEGEVKDVEQTTHDKAKAEGGDSDVEILPDDSPAPQFFDFVLPTQGWAKEMAIRLGLPADLINPSLPREPMAPVSLPRNWLPQPRIHVKPDGCCFFRRLGQNVCGKDSSRADPVQLHDTVRQRIQELWMKGYGTSIAWVKGVTDTGAFPMTKEEWNALFKNPTGSATISVIRHPATMLNCRIFTYTPVVSVPG